MLGTTTAFAVDRDTVTEIAIGTPRAEIYARIGMPEISSAEGVKEIYTLSNGDRAVLRYYGDILDMGFILVD